MIRKRVALAGIAAHRKQKIWHERRARKCSVNFAYQALKSSPSNSAALSKPVLSPCLRNTVLNPHHVELACPTTRVPQSPARMLQPGPLLCSEQVRKTSLPDAGLDASSLKSKLPIQADSSQMPQSASPKLQARHSQRHPGSALRPFHSRQCARLAALRAEARRVAPRLTVQDGGCGAAGDGGGIRKVHMFRNFACSPLVS